MTHRTNQPARSPPKFNSNWHSRRSISGFRTQGPTLAGFLLQNPSHPTRQRLYTNPAKSPSNLRWSSEFSTIFGEVSQIRPFPSYFSDFGAYFGYFDADLVSFYIFRRWFADSDDDFAAPTTTRSPPQPKTDLTDWLRRSVSGYFSIRPTLAGRVQAGSKTDPALPVDTSSPDINFFFFIFYF